MRILFIIDGLRKGGKERRFLELIKHLEKRNIFDYRIVMFHKEIEYQVEEQIKQKIIVIYKTSKKSISPFFSIYRIAKVFRPDYVHTWSSMVTFYTLPTILFRVIHLINSQITDAPVQFNRFSFFGIICSLNFLFSYRIIANSKAGLKAYDIINHKSMVIYNGFDFNRIGTLLPKLKVREKFGINKEFVVGMVATFSSNKDYETYISAARLILSKRSDIIFLCIGGGDDSIYRQTISTGITDNIMFLGNQNDVESIMNICDIGVLSTFSEGISNALLEFSALGIPIIGTNSGGTIELITNGVNGYLTEIRNANDLAAKIESLLNSQSDRLKMGCAGKEVVKIKFSIERMIYEFEQVYAPLNIQ